MAEAEAVTAESKQPCFLNALTSALPAGLIGWVFGLIPSMARNRSFSSTGLWLSDANLSGKQGGRTGFSSLHLFPAPVLSRPCLLEGERGEDGGIQGRS